MRIHLARLTGLIPVLMVVCGLTAISAFADATTRPVARTSGPNQATVTFEGHGAYVVCGCVLDDRYDVRAYLNGSVVGGTSVNDQANGIFSVTLGGLAKGTYTFTFQHTYRSGITDPESNPSNPVLIGCPPPLPNLPPAC